LSCWAIVAIKSRAQCKRRLAAVLEPLERLQLVAQMLDHVLATAEACPEIDRVLVVSPETAGLPDTTATVADSGADLNAALDVARAHARAAGATELVVLPADLPQLMMADLSALIAAGRAAGVAIAADRSGSGTNALYLRASHDLAFAFGAGSCAAHVAAARRVGVEPAQVRRPGLELDIDTPRDLFGIGGRRSMPPLESRTNAGR
jgi:2-phospho-L-lactate guanylyltransferase